MTAARRAAGVAEGTQPRVVSRKTPERIFQAQVVRLAQLNGWACFHERDSRGNTAGLPDLLLLKPPRAIYAELKRVGGRVRMEQVAVMAALKGCGLDVRLWTPDDWPEIEATLGKETANANH